MASESLTVGGPNGAGKTTFIRRFQTEFGYPYVGADEIAAAIAPGDSASANIAAAWEFIRRIDDHIARRASVIVESTLSGRTFARQMRAAREAGMTVFVFVDGPDTSVARVAQRVTRGGHHVPEEDVRRRFERALANFWRLYRPLSDQWRLMYNGEGGHREVAIGRSDRRRFTTDDARFDHYRRLAGLADDDLR